MLKDHSQLQLSLSPYQGLYDAIPQIIFCVELKKI